MGTRTTTIIIEPRSLMREALVSLMESLSYHVVGSVGSTNDLDRDVFKGAQPELVILGTLSADRALEATSTIRRRWQRAKITMLFETASSMDLQRLLASSLDACIPMFASPRTLLGTLQLIGCEHLRVFMVSDSAISSESSDRQDDGDSARQEGQALTTSLQPSFQITASQTSCAGNVLTNSPGDSTPRGGIHCLSEREEQILKALVRGHSNKVIARMCTVTEATVKVHVKSILRKIRVANRTQAAIWALKNAYFADDMDQTTRSVPMTDMQAVPSVSG